MEPQSIMEEKCDCFESGFAHLGLTNMEVREPASSVSKNRDLKKYVPCWQLQLHPVCVDMSYVYMLLRFSWRGMRPTLPTATAIADSENFAILAAPAPGELRGRRGIRSTEKIQGRPV